jgi:hypothetical protein
MAEQAVKRRGFVKITLFKKLTCAEGRATLGSDPSADKGGHTEGQGFQFSLDLLFEDRSH